MARSFNGSSDYIAADAATGFALGTDHAIPAFTWAGWVNGAAQSDKSFVAEGTSTTNTNFLKFGPAFNSPNNTLRLFISNGGGSTIVDATGTAVCMDSTWHHVIWTYDGSANYKAYVDGAIDLSGTFSSPRTISTTNGCRFGVLHRNTDGNFFNGKLAHWARWSRAISDAEAKALAKGLLPSHLAPDHYWPFWGIDSPEPDISGTSRVNGTLTGTSASTSSPPVSPYILRGNWASRIQAPAPVAKSDSDSASLTQSVLTAGPVTTKSDTDTGFMASSATFSAAVSSSDTPTVTAAVSSIGLSSSDTLAETDAGRLTDAIPPPAPQAETFVVSSTASIAATVTSADTETVTDSAAAAVASARAIADSDTGTLAELGSNASGGIGSAIIGVSLAFDNNAGDANPTWTRLDDPAGIV